MRARTELTNSDIIRGSRLTSSGVAAMNHSCRAGRRSSCCSRCRKKPAPMCGFHCTVISGYYSIRPHVTAISFSTAHGASRFPRRKACTKKSKQCCAVGEGSYVPHGLRATAAVRLIELGRFRGPGCGSYWHRDLNVLRGYVRGADGPPSHAEAGGKLIGHSKANSAKVPNP